MSVSVSACAEQKNLAQRWLMHNFGPQVPHIFHNNVDLSAEAATGAYCVVCKRWHGRPQGRPDVVSGGLPCPPFSPQRTKKGEAGSREGPAESHPLWTTTMFEFSQYLEVRRPRMFWLEQVPGFNKSLSSLGNSSPLELFSEQCNRQGYSLRAIQLDHRISVKVVRCRLFIFGCDNAEAGGQAGADWIYNLVESCINWLLEVHADVDVFSVVDPSELDQKRRRDDCLVPIR